VIPDDLVELGAVRGAYGIRGWVRVTPFAADGVVLEGVRRWWLVQDSAAKEMRVQEVRRHGESIVAKWQGCESREVAAEFKNATIAVARSDFPPTREGEHYLNDVIGYRVVNREGVELGCVSGLRTGPDKVVGGAQWLEVVREGNNRTRSLLIPLVDQYIEAIDPDAGVVRVDWQSDW
jgi:16S rRNA processing protein RimM